MRVAPEPCVLLELASLFVGRQRASVSLLFQVRQL